MILQMVFNWRYKVNGIVDANKITKITVTGKRTDSTGQFYENRIAEKTMAVMAFSMGITGEMIMTAIFVPFRRKRNRQKEKKQKGRGIWQKILADSQVLISRVKSGVKNGLPDTAYVGPLLCTGVVWGKSVPMRNGISYMGNFHFWHVNSVSFPPKCSLDISLEYLLID